MYIDHFTIAPLKGTTAEIYKVYAMEVHNNSALAPRTEFLQWRYVEYYYVVLCLCTYDSVSTAEIYGKCTMFVRNYFAIAPIKEEI